MRKKLNLITKYQQNTENCAGLHDKVWGNFINLKYNFTHIKGDVSNIWNNV